MAFASLVVALMAKKQARQAALLMSRTEAIAHLRQALGDLNRNGLATGKTVDSIQKALDLSHLVFGKEVRKDVEQAHISARLVQQGQDMDDGIVTLKEDLSKLIAQMNERRLLSAPATSFLRNRPAIPLSGRCATALWCVGMGMEAEVFDGEEFCSPARSFGRGWGDPQARC